MNQFKRERKYARSRNKELVVYAPSMSKVRKQLAERNGFNIVSSLSELKSIIIKKEGKK